MKDWRKSHERESGDQNYLEKGLVKYLGIDETRSTVKEYGKFMNLGRDQSLSSELNPELLK